MVGLVDNFTKPYLISRGSNLPFGIIFLGVIGGFLAYGFLGIFFGATLMAVAFRLVQRVVGGRGEVVFSFITHRPLSAQMYNNYLLITI